MPVLSSPIAAEAPSYSRIAVLRALQLGDLLVAIPAFRALRAGCPEAEITLIGLPWAADFAARFRRYIDRFVVFPGYDGIAEAESTPGQTQAALAAEQAYGYDLAVQLHGSGRVSNGFILELGARDNAGYFEDSPPAGWAYGAPFQEEESELLRALRLVEMIGCSSQGTGLEFPLYEADHLEAERLLSSLRGSAGPWIALHPGARSPARRWPAQMFAAAADHLAERTGATILLTGGPEEAETAHEVAEAMQSTPLVLAGQTSLGGLAAIMARLDLFIGNDTGPAHLAEAFGTRSITLFGPADRRRWAPLEQDRHLVVHRPVACSPCGLQECPIDHRCMRLIAPRSVAALAIAALDEEHDVSRARDRHAMRSGPCLI